MSICGRKRARVQLITLVCLLYLYNVIFLPYSYDELKLLPLSPSLARKTRQYCDGLWNATEHPFRSELVHDYWQLFVIKKWVSFGLYDYRCTVYFLHFKQQTCWTYVSTVSQSIKLNKSALKLTIIRRSCARKTSSCSFWKNKCASCFIIYNSFDFWW